MATFPSISPSERTHIPGNTPAKTHSSANGRISSVRVSNGRGGDSLQLRFEGLTTAQLHSLAEHSDDHGTWRRFLLSAAVWSPAGDPTPSGSSWRYVKAPDIEDPPGGACVPDGFHRASVELVMTPLPAHP